MGLKSGLASANQLPGFSDGLAIGRVRQKTWLAIDEVGTEAAAVTSAEATRSAEPSKTVSVSFDKPFVYALRYRPTGAILMAGYVSDPGEEQSNGLPRATAAQLDLNKVMAGGLAPKGGGDHPAGIWQVILRQ
jgi:hypothetical protein